MERFPRLWPFVRFTLAVLLPLLAGSLLYLNYRPKSLLLFDWLTVLGPAWTAMGQQPLPAWVVYNLPAGLWAFSFTSFLILVWQNDRSPVKWAWLVLPLLLGAGSEVGQLWQWVPGTFDVFDLLLYITTPLLSFLCFPSAWNPGGGKNLLASSPIKLKS